MKTLKVFWGIIITVILCVGIVWGWTGSDPSIGINTPADDSTVSRFTSISGWCWNSANDVDYYAIYAAKDINKDGTLSDTDYQGRIRLHKQEDFNRLNKYNQRLVPRGELKDFTSGDSVFVWINARNIPGDLAYPDTAVIGLTKDGDATVTDSMINLFNVLN